VVITHLVDDPTEGVADLLDVNRPKCRFLQHRLPLSWPDLASA
jgi:hypothetical protein